MCVKLNVFCARAGLDTWGSLDTVRLICSVVAWIGFVIPTLLIANVLLLLLQVLCLCVEWFDSA